MESFPHTANEREPVRVAQAAPGGADIATIPPQVLHQMVARVRTRPTERSPRPGSSSPLTPGVKLLTGSPTDGNPVYASPITDYVIFRQSDATSTTPMEPGGSRNWVETLFSNPSNPASALVDKASGQALIAASGVTPDYQDLGDVSS